MSPEMLKKSHKPSGFKETLIVPSKLTKDALTTCDCGKLEGWIISRLLERLCLSSFQKGSQCPTGSQILWPHCCEYCTHHNCTSYIGPWTSGPHRRVKLSKRELSQSFGHVAYPSVWYIMPWCNLTPFLPESCGKFNPMRHMKHVESSC